MTDRNELEGMLAAATEGPWGIAAYYTGTGPDERCHGMIVTDGDWPTGVIDENESPTSDSLSHDLALICFLRNNAQHYLSLMDEVERLRAFIEKTNDDFAFAAQSDCENGVRWLNERAAAIYLKDTPCTLKAIREFQDGCDQALGEQP